jgi:8-oxo-dGTP pyrophosphatase MutT (NUDIX family)
VPDPDPGFDFQRVEARVREILGARVPGWARDLDEERARVYAGAGDLRPAAVAVLLERVPGYNLILTKRTEDVEHHKGEISLAGGMADPGDPDAEATALREVQEELGVDPQAVRVLGRLDRLVTVTGFQVTPVVAAIAAGHVFRPHPAEVERVLRVPLAALRDPASWFEDIRAWEGRTYRLRSCRWGDDIIWGATSRIVQNFLAAIPPDVL